MYIYLQISHICRYYEILISMSFIVRLQLKKLEGLSEIEQYDCKKVIYFTFILYIVLLQLFLFKECEISYIITPF